MYRAFIALSVLVAAGCFIADVRGEDATDQWKPTELAISAQPIEAPVLKYRLLPTESELRPGNAAPILLRLAWEETAYFSQVVPTFHEWLSKPLDDPAWKDSRGVLDKNFYAEMKRAAFRRDADWEYPLGEKIPVEEIVLPDLQGARALIGYGLSAKARYHIGRREFDLARETILVSLADSRHYAQTPFNVVRRSCAAIANLTLDRVDELVCAPGSPNLYWALGTLPRPLLELRSTGEIEGSFPLMDIPDLASLDQPRTNEQWRKLCDDYVQRLSNNTAAMAPGKPKKIERGALANHARQALPRLLGIGQSAAAAMSDDEAVVRWHSGQDMRDSQLATALQCLSPPEALDRLIDLKRKVEEEGRKADLADAEIPGHFTAVLGLDAYAIVWRLQRRIDALRIVEAIRNHLALHGRLPEKLSDITEVGIPLDPMTGQPFEWKVEQGVGRLSAKSIADLPHPERSSLGYVIRVR